MATNLKWQRKHKMDRAALMAYITETYQEEHSSPWIKEPNYVVFRHGNNQKWFAVILDVPRVKLGLPGDGCLDVVNLKCDPIMISALRTESGVFPAYHMNKEHWLSVALDGSLPDDRLKMLLDMSYEATAVKR